MNDYSRILYRLAFLAIILITTGFMMTSSDAEPGQKAFKPNSTDQLSNFGEKEIQQRNEVLVHK